MQRKHVCAETSFGRHEGKVVGSCLKTADQRVLAVLLDLDLTSLNGGAEARGKAEAFKRHET